MGHHVAPKYFGLTNSPAPAHCPRLYRGINITNIFRKVIWLYYISAVLQVLWAMEFSSGPKFDVLTAGLLNGSVRLCIGFSMLGAVMNSDPQLLFPFFVFECFQLGKTLSFVFSSFSAIFNEASPYATDFRTIARYFFSTNLAFHGSYVLPLIAIMICACYMLFTLVVLHIGITFYEQLRQDEQISQQKSQIGTEMTTIITV